MVLRRGVLGSFSLLCLLEACIVHAGRWCVPVWVPCTPKARTRRLRHTPACVSATVVFCVTRLQGLWDHPFV